MSIRGHSESGKRLLGLVLIAAALLASNVMAQQDDFRRPEFSLPDMDGKERSISEWDGRAMIINFWATWCIPCKREIPLFNEIDAAYDDTDLQLLGIAVDSPANVRQYLAATPMSYPTLVEENRAQDVVALFTNEPMVLPFTIFLDHAGRVFWMQVEEIHRDQADVILNFIHRVRTGEISYEQAQAQLVDAVAAAVRGATVGP